MARIRNPRYAPEFLERKLSPSSYGVIRPPVMVAPTPPPPTFPPDPSLPPIVIPTPPVGPALPE
jgi:hypothetical protein